MTVWLRRNALRSPVVDQDMPITRLNHAVLYVRDAEKSARFYMEVLGFRPIGIGPSGFKGAAFLQAPGSTNDHDIGLFTIGSDGRHRVPAVPKSACTTSHGRSTPWPSSNASRRS